MFLDESGNPIERFPSASALYVAVSESRDLLAIARKDGLVVVVETSTKGATLVLGPLKGRPTAVAISPGRDRLVATSRGVSGPATGGVTNRLHVFDLTSGELLFERDTGAGLGRVLRFSPDGLLMGTTLGTIELWDVRRGERMESFRAPSVRYPGDFDLIARSDTGHGGSVRGLELSPDGATLFCITTGKVPWQRKLLVSDVKTRQLRGLPLDRPDRLYSLAISPDGRTLAIGTEPGRIEIWDTDMLIRTR
jgi:WD40 repeat protein